MHAFDHKTLFVLHFSGGIGTKWVGCQLFGSLGIWEISLRSERKLCEKRGWVAIASFD